MAFPRLADSFSDGRLATVFYRREQLHQLHDGLLQAQDAVVDAIVRDATSRSKGRRHTAAEASVELYLTLSAIVKLHEEHPGLQPKAQLQGEYSIARGRDSKDAREAVGVVVILPQTHSLIYSVLVPLSAAIAAGNCVAVVLEQTLERVPSVLADILQQSLDPDILEICSQKPAPEALAADPRILPVVQTGDVAFAGGVPAALWSPSPALTIAIVDRTADIDAAARHLVDARMSFGGRSPYGPDIVLVHEFAKKAFLNAAVRHAIKYMTDLTDPATPTSAVKDRPNGTASGIKTVTSGSDVGILDVDRSALPALGKTSRPALHVHAVRSTDDAIEVATDLVQGGTALAVLAFANLATAKYLLQFLPADAGFANALPRELLVGPAAPRGHPTSAAARYSPDQFSIPRPHFAETTALSSQIGAVLDTDRGEGSTTGASKQAQAALFQSLPKLTERAPVQLIEGYFERAFLVGFATKAAPIVAALGTLVYFGVRTGIRKLAAR